MSNVILLSTDEEIAAVLADMLDTLDAIRDLARTRGEVSPDALPAVVERIERLAAGVPRHAVRPVFPSPVVDEVTVSPFASKVPESTITPEAPTKVPPPIVASVYEAAWPVIDPLVDPVPDPSPILCQICGAARGTCVHDLGGEGSL